MRPNLRPPSQIKGKGTGSNRLPIATIRRSPIHLAPAHLSVPRRAVRKGLAQKNAAEFIDTPKVTEKKRRGMTLQEARLFLDATQDHRLKALFKLSLFGAMRVGELTALKWKDIDLKRGVVHVRSTMSKQWDKSYGIGETKTEDSERVLDFGVRGELPTPLDDLPSPGLPNAFVFPFGYQTIRRDFEAALKAAEIVPGLTIHSLRHTAITLGDHAGVSAVQMSRIAGHADVQTTLGIYTHPEQKTMQPAFSKIIRLVEDRRIA